MLKENLSACALGERVTCVGAGRLFLDRLASIRPTLHKSDRQCFFYRIARAEPYGGKIISSINYGKRTEWSPNPSVIAASF